MNSWAFYGGIHDIAIPVPDYVTRSMVSPLLPAIEGSVSMRKAFVATLMCGVIAVQPVSATVLTPAPEAVRPATSSIVPAVKLSTDAETAKVIEVGRRHYPRYKRYRRKSRGGAFGAGLAVGIMTALIAKGISESHARNRFDRCARDFRSFDYETGTIITRSGREVLCPYLR